MCNDLLECARFAFITLLLLIVPPLLLLWFYFR